MIDLAPQIEAFLMERGTWVTTQEICGHFGCDPRDLRSVGKVPGLCSRFAVSGMRGYIHYKFATVKDKLTLKHRKYRHAISQIRSFKMVEKSWQAESLPTTPYHTEKSTGQSLLKI
jgi:hypothetical protein